MLSLFLYAELNFVGAVILLLMLTSRHMHNFKSMPVDQQIFNGIMFLNLLIFVFDTGMWLSDNQPLPALRLVNFISTTGYYLLNSLICLLWLMYTDIKIYESKAGLVQRSRFYAIPAAVCMALTIASPFTGWLFIIDESNRYIRGPLLIVMVLAALFYLGFSFCMAIKDTLENGLEANNNINLLLVIYPLIMLAATALQIRYFGFSVIWVCSMLCSASIYINIQNAEIFTDHLTGLYNRRHLDQHLQRRIMVRHKKGPLFAILLDLDDFKKINDRFGHLVGDNALIRTGELLRKSCINGEDFIARLGGDKFIIVGERSTAAEVADLIKVINNNVAAYNHSGRSSYTLKLSMGYAVFHKGDTQDSFLAVADKAMYSNKLKNKTSTTNDAANDAIEK